MKPLRTQATPSSTRVFLRRPTVAAMMWTCSLLVLLLSHNAVSFSQHSPRRSRTLSRLSMSTVAADDEQHRMALVRQLQNAYYQSASAEPTVLEKGTGIMRNLPLWRVQWTELPGRANVLNVHEGIYTNMFETIIRGPKPWYFGHLFLPGGSENLRSNEKRFQIKTWEQEANDDARQTEKERSAVVGTLMQISDFRRLEDGSLILLVQALERFAVVDCIQNLPYSIASVQILPDLDQVLAETEEEAQPHRANEVRESFRFHEYEYDADFKLPLPDREYLSATNTWGTDLAKVPPFVPYAKSSLDLSKLPPVEVVEPRGSEDIVSLDEPSLESRLLKNDILKSLNFLREKGTGLSTNELEGRLWDALQDFCTASKLVLPSEVLCLLPPGRSWHDSPAIQRVSSDYPSKRRQRRLSFAASAFLEQTQRTGTDLRQTYLETPGTKERLRMVLESFEFINNMFYGRLLKK